MSRGLVGLILLTSSLLPRVVFAAATEPTAPALCLHAQESKGGQQSLLAREIVRQALLIAARDELSLPTRDEALREPFDNASPALAISTQFPGPAKLKLSLARGDAAEKNPLLNKDFAIPHAAGLSFIAGLTQAMEACSRGGFVDALKQAGFSGAANRRSETAIPADVEQQLTSATIFAQFAALRELHALVREQGESPALLGGLVRGYANLAEQIRFHFNASPKTFTARALLYAERMCAADPKSNLALWHRAYARAMAGLNAEALKDLEAAGAAPPDAPAWLKLLEPYCRYNTGALVDLAANERELSPMALYLAFRTVQYCGSQSASIEFAKGALKENPQCLTLIDAICDNAGVGYLHQSTTMGPETFTASISEHLGEMPQLPAAVKDVFDSKRASITEPAPRAEIAAALIDAGAVEHDTVEPSWAVLGRLMQETYFAHTFRRIRFLSRQWGVGIEQVTQYADAAKTLLGDHPNLPLIEAYALQDQPDKLHESLAKFRIVDANWAVREWCQDWVNWPAIKDLAHAIQDRVYAHSDPTVIDLQHYTSLYLVADTMDAGLARAAADWGKKLAEISPSDPVAIAAAIRCDWKTAEPKVAEWDEQLGDHPAVAALAKKYTELKRYDDAERCLKKYISHAPDEWAYTMLANNYLQQANEDAWLKTLEEFLTHEDYALSHAHVQVIIAKHFMEAGNFEKAQPYADAAAESWAGWAMWCASNCHEGLRDWPNAELWARRVSERYDDQAAEWYVFCRRTGQGDLEAAHAKASQFVEAIGAGNSQDQAEYVGYFHLLEENEDAAKAAFEATFQKYGDYYSGIQLAIMHDAKKDYAARDAILAALITKPVPKKEAEHFKAHIELVKLLKTQFDAAADGPIDLEKIDALIEHADVGDQTNFNYYVARFLDAHGQGDAAKTYYINCAGSSYPKWNRTLAWVELRKRGVEPLDLQGK